MARAPRVAGEVEEEEVAEEAPPSALPEQVAEQLSVTAQLSAVERICLMLRIWISASAMERAS